MKNCFYSDVFSNLENASTGIEYSTRPAGRVLIFLFLGTCIYYLLLVLGYFPPLFIVLYSNMTWQMFQCGCVKSKLPVLYCIRSSLGSPTSWLINYGVPAASLQQPARSDSFATLSIHSQPKKKGERILKIWLTREVFLLSQMLRTLFLSQSKKNEEEKATKS